MSFALEPPQRHAISACDAHAICLNGQRYGHSLLVGANGLLQAWDCPSFDALGAAHFQALAALDCELLLLGTGAQHRFAPAAWLAPLMARRMGFESMNTAAACRTYNLLASESRAVVAALIIEAAPQAQAD